MTKESERYVESVIKAMEILNCFEFHESLGLKQINEITAVNKSRIIRLCGSLEKMGYLKFNLETNKYLLGSRLLSLGKIYERNNTLISISRSILKELAVNTGESAGLFVIEDIYRVCIAREYGNQKIRYVIGEGQRIPIYGGASGKVLLAFCGEKLQSRILSKKALTRFTPNTIIDSRNVREELNTIRKQGYAFSSGERDPNAAALATPVYNHDKNVCAALALAWPAIRFSPEKNKRYLKALRNAAQLLSNNLGYVT